MRRTDSEAARSSGVSAASAGTVTGLTGPPMPSMSLGRPSPIAKARSDAACSLTASGVRLSIPRTTLESAICWETHGMPMLETVNAVIEMMSAVTIRLTAPPKARSTAPAPLNVMPRRMRWPRAEPAAFPAAMRTTAVMTTPAARQPLSARAWLTSGTAKKAAAPPARKPRMPARLTTNPARMPLAR